MSEPVDTDKVREWGICDCENLCDEVDDLRARLAEVEAELDRWDDQCTRLAEWNSNQARMIVDLKAEVLDERDKHVQTYKRLAEVEAERDQALNDCHHVPALAEAEARLAAVEALCAANTTRYGVQGLVAVAEVRAAARGEGRL